MISKVFTNRHRNQYTKWKTLADLTLQKEEFSHSIYIHQVDCHSPWLHEEESRASKKVREIVWKVH
jgi:hypothetical protein